MSTQRRSTRSKPNTLQSMDVINDHTSNYMADNNSNEQNHITNIKQAITANINSAFTASSSNSILTDRINQTNNTINNEFQSKSHLRKSLGASTKSTSKPAVQSTAVQKAVYYATNNQELPDELLNKLFTTQHLNINNKLNTGNNKSIPALSTIPAPATLPSIDSSLFSPHTVTPTTQSNTTIVLIGSIIVIGTAAVAYIFKQALYDSLPMF